MNSKEQMDRTTSETVDMENSNSKTQSDENVRKTPKTKAEIQRDYAKRSGYKNQKKYAETHIKQIALRLNISTDSNILQKLDEVPNKQGYIKALIRADIAKGSNQ